MNLRFKSLNSFILISFLTASSTKIKGINLVDTCNGWWIVAFFLKHFAQLIIGQSFNSGNIHRACSEQEAQTSADEPIDDVTRKSYVFNFSTGLDADLAKLLQFNQNI